MENRKELYNSLSKIAFGYLLILINLDIAYIDILPDFVGYILFISALNGLKEECKNISLLKPLGIILAVWAFISWLSPFIQLDSGYLSSIITLIITVINIYFNFQLLTEISLLAQKYQSAETDLAAKIITRRNIYTVLCTVMQLSAIVTTLLAINNGVITTLLIILTVISVIVAFMIAHALFAVRKLFKEDEYAP